MNAARFMRVYRRSIYQPRVRIHVYVYTENYLDANAFRIKCAPYEITGDFSQRPVIYTSVRVRHQVSPRFLSFVLSSPYFLAFVNRANASSRYCSKKYPNFYYDIAIPCAFDSNTADSKLNSKSRVHPRWFWIE